MTKLQGNVITFTVMPDRDAMRDHIAESAEDYGWESDKSSAEFESWLNKLCEEETEDRSKNLHRRARMLIVEAMAPPHPRVFYLRLWVFL